MTKLKDVDRKKKNNLQNLFKKISSSPEELKTHSLKYYKIER